MSDYNALKQRLENRRKVYLAQGASDPDYGEALDAIRTLEERVGGLERELVEARKDGERLDWIEASLYGIGFFDSPDERPSEWFVCEDDVGGRVATGSTLRAAIDAAREPEGDGPEDLDYPPTPAERLEMADRARRVK